jgi:plastocyanin
MSTCGQWRSRPRRQAAQRLLLGVLLAAAGSAAAGEGSATRAPSDTAPEERIIITMRARQFEPSTVTLRAGRKTALVLENLDAELHAFVPGDLFKGVNLNVSGNGAPEFGPEGFKRVIIPSLGQAEIRFVPEQPGQFPYRCDMPGHEMRATIIVQ